MAAVLPSHLSEQCNLTQAYTCTSQTVLKRQSHDQCRVSQQRLDGVIVPAGNVEERLRAVYMLAGRNVQIRVHVGVGVRVIFILQGVVIKMERYMHAGHIRRDEHNKKQYTHDGI